VKSTSGAKLSSTPSSLPGKPGVTAPLRSFGATMIAWARTSTSPCEICACAGKAIVKPIAVVSAAPKAKVKRMMPLH